MKLYARASRRRHIIFQSTCITRVFALVFFRNTGVKLHAKNMRGIHVRRACRVFKIYNFTKDGRSDMRQKLIFCVLHSAGVHVQRSYHETCVICTLYLGKN